MRTGTNPAKTGIPAYSPQTLGVALIVYIPFTQGYHRDSLQIFKYQLASLRASTSTSYDLLVFDNGSAQVITAELKKLQEQGWIDWLILSSHNMGKAGAWNWIFSAMPNPLICYADSDVLFRPGWLEASQKLMDAFPQAGMVGAQPNFFDVMEGQGQAQQALHGSPEFEFQDYWPEKTVIDEYCQGIGAAADLAASFYQNPLPSVVHTGSRLQAVLGASHMQFLIPAQLARQAVPLPATQGLLRKETMSLDYKIDQLGYLHLSATQPYVFHMGNTLSEALLEKVTQVVPEASREASLPAASRPVRPRSARWLSRLAANPRLQPHMVRLYNALFHALYAGSQVKK
jgi:hypothetical protein